MERMTVRDGLVVKLVPAFKQGDFASQNVLHRLADLEDEMENRENGTITFTKGELEAIAFALDHLHGADLSFMANDIVSNVESAMDKLGLKYTSQIW